MRLELRGAVQGVGFRPFVFRLASELSVSGWIVNGPEGVVIEVEGGPLAVAEFATRLESDLPPRAAIHESRQRWVDPSGDRIFEIRPSTVEGPRTAVVLPDLATCEHCRREILDPAGRRHGYAFTNCTDCGPRFSIVRALPYDRPNTTMAGFAMCPACAAEYADPADRRFHAQPNACPVCGPRLELWDPEGEPPAGRRGETPLQIAARALRDGRVLAVKGLGGFHLMTDAADEVAVARLRERKHRPSKPLALMAATLEQVRALCVVST
jgi:hydrogenase maturation protein HypF